MSALAPKLIARTPSIGQHRSSIAHKFLVETTDLGDGADAAEAAVMGLGLCPIGYVQSDIRSDHINRNPLWYEVEITFSTTTGNSATDPLQRPSILTSSYNESTEPYFIDAAGKQVINTAGDPYDPMPQRRTGSLILQITKNMSLFPAVDYDAIKYSTNSGEITIRQTAYAANTLLFLPPTVQEVYENVSGIFYHYFATTFRLAADHTGHKDDLVSRGYRQVASLGDIPAYVTGDDGLATGLPVGLDASGAQVAPGQAPATTEFQPYPSLNWGIDFS